MSTFLVLSEIFECSPLMIGGSERTTPFASLITGYRGLPSRILRKGLRCRSFCVSVAYVQCFEELDCVGFGGFVQGDEPDGLGSECFVGVGTLHGVEVVSAEGYERPASAEVVVQLVLEVDEAVVGFLREGDVSEDRADADFSEVRELASTFSTDFFTWKTCSFSGFLTSNLTLGTVPM